MSSSTDDNELMRDVSLDIYIDEIRRHPWANAGIDRKTNIK